jgi:uncharacterized coiled-coil protein SlyX
VFLLFWVQKEVKILKGNGKVYTLQEASEITGLKVQTLRMRIKSGKLEAFKNPSKHGETWLIKAYNLKKTEEVDNDRLRAQEASNLNGSKQKGSIEGYPSIENSTVEAQKEHIGTLQRTLQNFEGILTIFQQRIKILEVEREEMAGKIRLLPAPLETLPIILETKENKIAELEAGVAEKDKTIARSQETIKALEEALQRERSRSWWQKLWGK